MAAVARRNVEIKGMLGMAESWLLGSTTLATDSPFAFGVSKARMTTPKKTVAPSIVVARSVGDALGELRERIKEFLDGSFSPKNLQDLLNYLGERMLRLENRKSPDGSNAHYLVDVDSNETVLASLVDSRLSRPGLARTFGQTMEAEAEGVRRRTTRTPEQVIAMALRNQNAGRLLSADQAMTPFEDWEDVMFSAPAMFDGREICMQGDVLWLGTAIGAASEDAEENRRMMRKAQLEGKSLVYPAASAADVAAGRLTPGMPILLKEGAVRLHAVDPRLSSANLTVAYGMSLRERFLQMQQRYSNRMKELRNGGVADDKVIDLAAFRRQFARSAAPAPTPAVARPRPAPASRSIDRSAPDSVVRHEIGADGAERIVIVDRGTGTETPYEAGKVLAGRYLKEDSFGLPAGYLVVDAEGGYSHFDQHDRFHNSLGPAIVPHPGSDEAPRYFIDGVAQSTPEGHDVLHEARHKR